MVGAKEAEMGRRMEMSIFTTPIVHGKTCKSLFKMNHAYPGTPRKYTKANLKSGPAEQRAIFVRWPGEQVANIFVNEMQAYLTFHGGGN